MNRIASPASFTVEIYVERPDCDDEITVVVVGEVEPYIPGRLSGPPEDCYPAEGGFAEVVTAKVNGVDFALTAEETKMAEEALEDAAREDREQDPRYDGDDSPADEPDYWA